MTVLFALFLVAHGLIHLIGFAKAFGFAQLPQLTQPVSQTLGLLWLAATLLFLASAWALYAWPRGWWLIGACAIVVSMVAIAHSWSDAKFGALANVLALIGVVVENDRVSLGLMLAGLIGFIAMKQFGRFLPLGGLDSAGDASPQDHRDD